MRDTGMTAQNHSIRPKVSSSSTFFGVERVWLFLSEKILVRIVVAGYMPGYGILHRSPIMARCLVTAREVSKRALEAPVHKQPICGERCSVRNDPKKELRMQSLTNPFASLVHYHKQNPVRAGHRPYLFRQLSVRVRLQQSVTTGALSRKGSI
ncbi:hypothetical protein BJ508DRAFT_310807 [Ascobolus immersus RN42]|uniref:Uncharacterized protein n=1 Tax=Ascobolus immersus RN42 TaxID=1160509 RepID=A0A3N4HUF9_ASCIM|nr:hypothetical protein BJ508DRAFT_310807 [Ascobolus immersus RN42]